MLGPFRENALYWKEVVTLLRTPRAMGVLFVYLAVLGILTVALWPQEGLQTLAGQKSDTLFTALCLGQLVLLVLVTPAFSANSITYEKERNTLDVLYGTLLTPGQIFWAKLAGATTLPILLVLSSLPFAALSFILGGITIADVLLTYAILVLTGLLVATMGLMVSSYARHSGTAAVIVYVAVIGLCGVVVVPAAMLIKHMPAVVADTLHYVRSLSPFQAMTSAVHPEWSNYGDYRTGQFWPSWALFLFYAVAGVIVMLAIAYARLRRPQSGLEFRAVANPDEGATRAKRIARRIYYLVDAGRPKRSLGLWSNMVFLKEIRTSKSKSKTWIIRMMYVSLVMALVLAIGACIGSPKQPPSWMAQVLVIFQMTLLILLGPSMSASTISGEIENMTWETLRMTRISVPSLLLGKLMASLLPLLLSVVAMLPVYAAVAFVGSGYTGTIAWGQVFWVAVLGATTALFCTACGLFASSLFSRTSRATAMAYGLVGAFFVVTLLGLLLQGTILSAEYVRALYVLNPMIVGLEITGMEQLGGMHLLPEHLRIVGAGTLVLLLASFVRVFELSRPR